MKRIFGFVFWAIITVPSLILAFPFLAVVWLSYPANLRRLSNG
jgi:hypothetical protein